MSQAGKEPNNQHLFKLSSHTAMRAAKTAGFLRRTTVVLPYEPAAKLLSVFVAAGPYCGRQCNWASWQSGVAFRYRSRRLQSRSWSESIILIACIGICCRSRSSSSLPWIDVIGKCEKGRGEREKSRGVLARANPGRAGWWRRYYYIVTIWRWDFFSL